MNGRWCMAAFCVDTATRYPIGDFIFWSMQYKVTTKTIIELFLRIRRCCDLVFSDVRDSKISRCLVVRRCFHPPVNRTSALQSRSFLNRLTQYADTAYNVILHTFSGPSWPQTTSQQSPRSSKVPRLERYALHPHITPAPSDAFHS